MFPPYKKLIIYQDSRRIYDAIGLRLLLVRLQCLPRLRLIQMGRGEAGIRQAGIDCCGLVEVCLLCPEGEEEPLNVVIIVLGYQKQGGERQIGCTGCVGKMHRYSLNGRIFQMDAASGDCSDSAMALARSFVWQAFQEGFQARLQGAPVDPECLLIGERRERPKGQPGRRRLEVNINGQAGHGAVASIS